MRTRVAACALGVSAMAVLAGCGSGAVSSSSSLDSLGKQMADPARTLAQMVSDTGAGELTEQDDATRSHPCDGGHRRVYKATAVVPRTSGDDEKKVRNVVNLLAQAELKPSGAKITTDLGSDSSPVPATLDFASSSAKKADKRTYRTHVTVGEGSYTWQITGKTACIKG